MAKTDPIDPNVPAGSEDPKLGDNRIRELARAVAEILGIDHYIGADGGAGVGYNEDAAGEHKRIKFNAPLTSDPANAANKGFLYTKDVAGKVELFWQDEDGNVRQLTSGGKLHSDGGFSMPTGQVATIETIRAVDATGVLLQNDTPATVITIGDDGVATLADGSKMATDEAPTADAQIANKKCVDDSINAAVAGPGFWKTDGSTIFSDSMTAADTWQDLDLSAKVGSNDALVFLEVHDNGSQMFAAKPKGYGSGTFNLHVPGNAEGFGCAMIDFENNHYAYIIVATNSSGVIQIGSLNNTDIYTIKLVGYVK
jgi:hypothetical protein